MFDHTCTCGCRATIHNPVYGWQCLPCWNDAKAYVETDGVVRCPDTGKRIQQAPQVIYASEAEALASAEYAERVAAHFARTGNNNHHTIVCPATCGGFIVSYL